MTPEARNAFARRAAAHRARMYPGTVMLGGAPITGGSLSEGLGALENGDGGQTETTVLTWRIAKSILPVEPAKNSLITARGQVWIIRDVRGEDWAVEWVVRAAKQ